MKTHTTLALLLLFTATIARAQAPAQVVSQPLPPAISTAGSAEIHVKPDTADLSFEIEIRNVDLAAARKQQAAITAKLLTALRAAGIEEKDLNASQITISPTWNERRGVETASVRFYSVSQSVSCTTHDVDKVPEINTAAIASGVTSMTPVVFSSSELRKYRDQARQQAIRAAKEKADALAGELGSKVGKPLAINEYEPYRSYGGANGFNNVNTMNYSNTRTTNMGDNGDEAARASYAPGTITITANIAVTFLLE